MPLIVESEDSRDAKRQKRGEKIRNEAKSKISANKLTIDFYYQKALFYKGIVRKKSHLCDYAKKVSHLKFMLLNHTSSRVGWDSFVRVFVQ